MERKKQLLEEANLEFPEFYHSRKGLNPDYLFAAGTHMPQATLILVKSVRYEDEDSPYNTEGREPEPNDQLLFAVTKVEGRIELVSRLNKKYWLKYVCFSDSDDAQCFIVGRESRNIAHFVKEFLGFFFYHFLSARNIHISDWNELDVKKR